MKKIVAYLNKRKNGIINTISLFVLVFSPQVVLAAPTGNGLKTWVIDLAKNAVICFFLYRVVSSYAKQSVGMMAFAVLFGAVVLWIVNSPDSAASIFRQIGELVGQ